ncbi:hypothetical protein CSE16_02630 [Solibacillus sp. R5-41]|uniref:hypothetical protein n=1 Tax=Solibacillus sp. R5-41 TaxID=2048654 RepID=UPI000C126558|nr:hypothetical protein [Solibacillus sp. R5-41]ATP39004.1 hypothetical protein CSE16_02630 [Solibacillus sp. R5-41]
MNAFKRLAEVMLEKYDFYVPLSEVGYETVFLYKEEMDEQLVPARVVDHLEGPIETESASYIDENGDEHLVILVETGSVDPYEVWLLNGEVIPNNAGSDDYVH